MSTATATAPASAPAVTFTRTKRGGNAANPTTEYSALLRTVRDAGLLSPPPRLLHRDVRRALTAALGAVGVGFVLLGDSWFQLIIAGVLGIILTQFAFLAHEASHRQVFTSGKANDMAGRTIANLFVGISYSWWMTKHSRHHANPNIIGKDPDIDRDFVSFTETDAAKARGLYAWVTRRQGYLFFPILMLEGLNLHLHGFRTVFGRGKVDKRWLEIVMLLVARRRLPRGALPAAAPRHGVRLPRCAARRLRRVHGRILRPEPQGHAHPAARLARSTSSAARCSPPQHQGRRG